MSREMAKLAFRLQKAFAPTVHVLLPKVLFTSLVAQLVKESGDSLSACRELFKRGVQAGSLAVTSLASAASLKRFWPDKDDPRSVASYAELVCEAFWQIFVGHKPRVKASVLDERGLVWVEIEAAGDAFYNVVAPPGVNTLYFVAGMLEGAFETMFSIIGVEREWRSMWRTLDSRGVCGFIAGRGVPQPVAERLVEARQPSFFRLIDWGQSVAIAEEMFGIEAEK